MVNTNTDVLTPSQMAAALRRAGFPIPVIPIMIAIGLAESGGKVHDEHRNKNGTVDYGWLQVNSVHGFSPEVLLTVDGNAQAAKIVYDRQGLQAWSTYNSGAYRSHLGAAEQGASSPDASPVQNALPGSSVVDSAAWLIKLGSVVTSGDFWRRVGIAALGAALLMIAVSIYVKHEVRSI